MSEYWDAIQPVWDTINIYEDGDIFLASTQGISQPIVAIYAAHFCQSEIHNGGFLQFFWNNTGVLAPEAIKGFHLIGMPLLADLVSAAASPLGHPYPRGRENRWDALLAASNLSGERLEQIFAETKSLYSGYATATQSLGFDQLDREFWELAKQENGGFEEAANAFVSSLPD